MASRYQTLSFSKTVAAGATESFGLTIPYNIVNIAKIKVVASPVNGPWKLTIFKNSAAADEDIVYSTAQFSGNLMDPVWDDGVTVKETNYGFVCAYEDALESLQMYIAIKNLHSASMTFTGTVIVDVVPSSTGSAAVTGVPSELKVKTYSQGLKIIARATAGTNNSTVDLAEFRAVYVSSGLERAFYDLRTVAEGGTFAHNGTTQLIVTSIEAGEDGAQHIFTSPSAGRWYFAWRLRNSIGWSNWSDGNAVPAYVMKYVDTRGTADTEPPQDWEVWIEDGPTSNTIVVHASRPKIAGDIISGMVAQILDANDGPWVTLLAGSDADNLKLDGRTFSYSLDEGRNTLTDVTSAGWGDAAPGDLVLLDVRGGAWDEDYCQWGIVRDIDGQYLTIHGFFMPQVLTNLRIVIIKSPWSWTDDGYGSGMYPQQQTEENQHFGDTDTTDFVSDPIEIPSGTVTPEARVWFENNYSRSDDGMTHSTGKVGMPGEQTFTNFCDRKWWVPIYGMPDWATLSFNQTTGAVTITAVTPRPTAGQPSSLYGVKGRFDIYPDLTGVLKIRVKFTNVHIPAYIGGNPSRDGASVGMFFTVPQVYGVFPLLRSLIWGNNAGTANAMFMLAESIFYTDYIAPASLVVGSGYSNYLSVSRPSAGYTIELKYGLASATGSGHNELYNVTTAEYRLNSGSWIALTGIALGKLGGFNNAAVDGITPILGFVEPYQTNGNNLSTFYATLSEFEIITGIVRRNRIIGARSDNLSKVKQII